MAELLLFALAACPEQAELGHPGVNAQGNTPGNCTCVPLPCLLSIQLNTHETVTGAPALLDLCAI